MGEAPLDEAEAAAWRALLARAKGAECPEPAWAEHELWKLYGPLCGESTRGPRGALVVAHLGQSLDGRIAPPGGAPEAITGPEDMVHNHRMRALCDAVLVGAGTVHHDDPKLNVRLVPGENPWRVVVDPRLRLPASRGIFQDELAPTLLLCDEAVHREQGLPRRHGRAEIVPVAGGCGPRAVVQALARRGLRRVFIEGGGVTVSRFLSARALHVLQITVSPMILGQGRPGVTLPGPLRLRVPTARFHLGEDVLFQCQLFGDCDLEQPK